MLAWISKLGEFKDEAEAMSAHRRAVIKKKFDKAKQSFLKVRAHRLADLKVTERSVVFGAVDTDAKEGLDIALFACTGSKVCRPDSIHES